MFESMFQSTTIPVLEQVVGFAQARHNVLAGNIANLDTPGYKVRDLSVEDFQKRLDTAIEDRHRAGDGVRDVVDQSCCGSFGSRCSQLICACSFRWGEVRWKCRHENLR